MWSPKRPPVVTSTGPSTGRLKMPVVPDLFPFRRGSSRPTFTLERRISPCRTLVLHGGAVARDPVDVVDVRYAPDASEHLLDVLGARRPEGEARECRAVLDGIDPRGEYVHARVGDHLRDVAQEVHPVER